MIQELRDASLKIDKLRTAKYIKQTIIKRNNFSDTDKFKIIMSNTLLTSV